MEVEEDMKGVKKVGVDENEALERKVLFATD